MSQRALKKKLLDFTALKDRVFRRAINMGLRKYKIVTEVTKKERKR